MLQHHLFIHFFSPLKKEKIIQSQLVIVVGFLILHLLTNNTYLLNIALGLGLIFLILPSLGNLIIKGWFFLGEILGRINGTILLSVIYFVVLVPTAMIKRITSGNSIKFKAPKNSNFKERNHQYKPKDLKYGW